MTRDEALLKLLTVEPAQHDEIVRITGWPAEETIAALERLRHARLVTHFNGHGGRWFHAVAATTDGARR